MTDINRLIASIKRRSAHAKEYGDEVTFVKLEDLNALVAVIEKSKEVSGCPADVDLQGWVKQLAAENARYSMSAGHADQRMAESRAVRSALGFKPDADDVSPSDLVEAINQIVAELCVIRTAHPQPLGPAMDAAIDAFNAEEMPETGMLNAYFILRESIRIKTPATDRIVAEAEARGVEKFAAEQRGVAERLKIRGGDVVTSSIKFCLNSAEEAEDFAKQLREGADK